MKIYISGPMSGYPELNFPEFGRAAEHLRVIGFSVISPAEIEQPSKRWEDCMKRDIREMMTCDKVAVLKGWQRSKGAKIEVDLAMQLGMDVVDAYTLLPVAVFAD